MEMQSWAELGCGIPARGTEGEVREDGLCSGGGHTIWTSLGTWCLDPNTSESGSRALLCLGLGSQGTQRALMVGRAPTQSRPWTQTAVGVTLLNTKQQAQRHAH